MVRGMTRRIVEIKDTGSTYFERAIFFVRTDMPQSAPEDTLAREASRIVDRFCSDLYLRKPRRNKIWKALKTVLSVLVGCGITVLTLKLLNLI